MNNWDIKEVNIPRLPPPQARWLEEDMLAEDYELEVDRKVVATWRHQASWASIEDVYKLLYEIRKRYPIVRDEDIVINGGWPQKYDKLFGITI